MPAAHGQETSDDPSKPALVHSVDGGRCSPLGYYSPHASAAFLHALLMKVAWVNDHSSIRAAPGYVSRAKCHGSLPVHRVIRG